ncbi:MAG: hypothetical protein ACRD1K_16550 [Acidimicrobiales bacterium]
MNEVAGHLLELGAPAVTDAGSTKSGALSIRSPRFVGGHPMAGS